MDFSAIPLTGLYIFGVGAIIGVISFTVALLNMGTAATGGRSAGGLIAGHLGAMAGMAAGSLVSVGGIVLFIVHALQASGAQ